MKDTFPNLTAEDLNNYLTMIDKKMNHYKAEQVIKPNIYNLKMIKKLDKMACYAIYRFHNPEVIEYEY